MPGTRPGGEGRPAVSSLTTAEFAMHVTLDHPDMLAGARELRRDLPPDLEAAYRSFHRRIHRLGTMEHDGPADD